MYHHNKGVILRSTKYSESSLILDIYTLEKGRRSYIISGVRSKKSKTKAGLLQVMGLVDFIAYEKQTTGLIRIKEIKADHLYQLLPFDVLRSCLGVFLMEVCSKSIRETEPNEELYSFIRSSLIELDQNRESSFSLFHIEFLLGLSKHLGLFIQNNYSESNKYLSIKEGSFVDKDFGPNRSMDEACSKFLFHIMNKDTVKIPKHQRRALLDDLISFYQYHVDSFGKIKSLDVLRSIFS